MLLLQSRPVIILGTYRNTRRVRVRRVWRVEQSFVCCGKRVIQCVANVVGGGGCDCCMQTRSHTRSLGGEELVDAPLSDGWSVGRRRAAAMSPTTETIRERTTTYKLLFSLVSVVLCCVVRLRASRVVVATRRAFVVGLSRNGMQCSEVKWSRSVGWCLEVREEGGGRSLSLS